MTGRTGLGATGPATTGAVGTEIGKVGELETGKEAGTDEEGQSEEA
jgi:hypothetical protein